MTNIRTRWMVKLWHVCNITYLCAHLLFIYYPDIVKILYI